MTVFQRQTRFLQRRGKKLLVLDPKISAYLGFLTEITLLREHGVERRAGTANQHTSSGTLLSLHFDPGGVAALW